ncbi:MAG TPA: PriCT-2 domain-containing protein [Burkholderiaceae bacterium]|nr:PriCT-2 domain-containing protein [Burkholderiaceae bacterium]
MNSRANKMQKRTSALCKGIPEKILTHTLNVCFGANAHDTSPKPQKLTVKDLLSRFTKPDSKRGRLPLSTYLALDKKDEVQKKLRFTEKDGEYIILGTFARPNTRAAKDMQVMSGFMIDIDGGNFSRPDIEKIMEGTFCIAFTTYSHHPGDPRWRILIPYATPVSPDDHHKVYVFFNAAFKGALDSRCDTTAQIWFTPACPFDAVPLYQVFTVDGNLLDVGTVPEVPVKPKAHLPARPNVMSVDLERVRSALSAIPADDRTTWVNFGIAMKQNLPQDTANELWLEWSKKSDKFDSDDAEATWASFKDAPEADAITLGSVFYEAKKHGWADTFEPMHAEAERLNQSHFVAFSGGKNYVFAETYNHEMRREVLQAYPLKDFKEHHANRRARVKVGNKFEDVPVVGLWYQHPARRTFNQIVFMPGQPTPVGTYNTWRGFSVVPSQGNWALFKNHIRDNICNGDQASFDYLIGWMAFAVQHPDQPPGVAVVLQGGRGTGKGKFASTFMALFGTHALQITQSSHLVGKFNQHLRDCVLLFVDEAVWAG